MIQNTDRSKSFETILSLERARLVRLCTRFTGDSNIAEDLAQETLLEAWRHFDALREQERIPQWLSGIARNVCLRWARKQGRNLLQFAESLPLEEDATQMQFEDTKGDDFDIEAELARKELIELLDRALALLTPEVRTLLIARYIEEIPLAEVAAQLGMNTGAVTMRLQRGKIALRRILTTELGHELTPYRLGTTYRSAWEEAPLWCIFCGQHRIVGRYRWDEHELWLKCPVCSPEPDHFFVHTHSSSLLSGVKGYRRAFSRITSWINMFYHPHLLDQAVPCRCSRTTPLRVGPLEGSTLAFPHGLHYRCDSCGTSSEDSLEMLVLALPETQRFYRRHPRVHFLPAYEAEVDGQAAIVTSIESATSQDRLVVVSAAHTYGVLRCYGNDA